MTFLTFPRVLVLAGIALVGFPGAAGAQSNYPTKPIKLVSGFNVGSFSDLATRAVGDKLGELLGQAVVVENRVGAAGTLAAHGVAQSAPDGYTLLAAPDGLWGLAPFAFKSLAFNPVDDFEPIAAYSVTPIQLVVHSALGVSNLSEFVALMKANPGKYGYGSSGRGTVHHLTFEVLQSQLGLKVEHVPYRGGPLVKTAMIQKEVMIGMMGYAHVAAEVEKGTFKSLALTSHSLMAPNVPTFKELGVKDVDFSLGSGILAPVKTPAPVIATLAAAFKKALSDPQVKKRITDTGAEPLNEGPAEFRARIRADVALYGNAAKLVGLERE